MPTLLTRTRARSSESGSVLLMVLVLMTILGTMAVSFAGSSDDRIHVVADGSAALRAEFAAQSGVEYAMRRMQFAPRWTGTDPAGIALADGSVFHVEVLEDAFVDGGDTVKLKVRGESPDSACQLGVDADVSTGWSADADVAIAVLGNEFYMRQGVIRGDILVTDMPDKLHMWDWDAEQWVLGGYGEIEGYVFENAMVEGDLFKYSTTEYGVSAPEHRVNAPVRAPKIDLDWYLEPGPGKVHYYGEQNLMNVSHTETVVFVLDENKTISLSGCNFPGGVVVHCPKEFDTLGMYRNKILLKHGTRVGGGEGGCQPYIGLIAPGCEVQFTHEGCAFQNQDHSDIDGFSVWNEVFMVRNGRINGQLVVLNEVTHMRDSEIIFDPEVAANVPYGISFDGTDPYADMHKIYEWFDQE